MTTCFRQMKIVAVFLCGLCLQGMVQSAAAQSRDAQTEGKSLSQLVADLKDSDPAVREQAAKALGALGRRSPADVVKPLAEVLQDENPKVRLAAVIALGSIGPNAQEALPALKPLLEDGDESVRRAAAGVIRRIAPRNVPDRPRDTPSRPTPSRPTKLHNGKTVDQWLEQLKAGNDEERVEAAFQLVNYRPSADIPVEPIVAALKDPSEKVRAYSADVITNSGPRAKAAVQPLIELLKDPNFEVHSAAVDALGNIGPEAAEAVAPLILELDKDDQIELKHVVDALGRIDRKGQSVQPLINVLKRRNLPGDGLNRYKAAVALGNIGANAKDAIPELLAFLRNDDDDYRDGAADALGKLGRGDEQVAAALAAALKDDASVRKTAVLSLGLIGPVAQPHLPAIRTLLNDPDEEVRQVAAATVQRLSRERNSPVATRPTELPNKSGNGELSIMQMLEQLETRKAWDGEVEWRKLTDEANSLREKKQYDRGVVVAKKALQVAEQAVGPEHPDVAISLRILAKLYLYQRQYAQAEPLYKRSLAIREKALGLNHADVARSLDSLANLYRKTGRAKEAELLEKRAAAIQASKR